MPFPRIAGALRNIGSTLINGAQSPYLLPEEQAAANAQRKSAMIASLLRSSAPTPQGMGPGAFGALGMAAQAGNQAQADAQENAIRMRMLSAQMAQLNQGGQAPADIRTMQALGFPLTPDGFKQFNEYQTRTVINKDESPIPIAQLDSVRLPDGSTPPIGTTPSQARALGAKVVSSAEQQKAQQGDAALGILGQLRDLAIGESGVFNDVKPGLANRAAGALGAGIGLLTQDDPRVSRYQDMSQATLAPFIKFLGETGSLAKDDVARAIGLLPRLFPLPDTKEVATEKLNALEEIINRGVSNLKSGKRAESAPPSETPPLPPGFTLDE